jgi:alkylhydroperoxidase domain protein
LFVSEPVTGLSPEERLAAALRVAVLHEEQSVVDHYREALLGTGQGSAELAERITAGTPSEQLPARLSAILSHVDLLVLRPAAARPADLGALAAAGLSSPEIITLSEVIAFVSFQIRVYVGLTLIRGDHRPTPAIRQGPRDAPTSGFTQEQIGWKPWIEPFAADEASEQQRAVLPGQRLYSPYFRLLALDPEVLGERTATDNGIFHTPGGLPRAERELSAAVTSRVNGCVFCASVHSRLAAQLSGRTDDVQSILEVGVAAKLDDRWRVITDLAAALTLTPPAATQDHLGRLRQFGLGDLELLDAIQASAFFAWANRLMLTIGEPEPALPPAAASAPGGSASGRSH